MKLIIDVPEYEYQHIKEIYEKNETVEATYSYIYHGIPLGPCDDAISRKAAVNIASGFCHPANVADELAKLPSVNPQTHWIPVSERMPEENYYCLCCDKDGYMTIGSILKWSKDWVFEDDEIYIDVAAWMPLPEPYTAESEGAG